MDEGIEDTEEAGWIAAARAGDEAAFGRLVDRYKDTVFATIVAITGDFDAAHDIAQETFLRAWFGLARLETSGAFGPWLRTIARNRGRTFLERRQHRPARESIEVDDIAHPSRSPHDDAERAERRGLVWRAIERLPDTSREVLLLYYMEGLTTPRMATQLGIAEPAVRQRLRRARLQMQEEVEEMVADTIRDESPGDDFADSVTALLDRTREIFRRVDYRAAVPVLETAREQAPDDALVSLLLAEAYTFTRGAEDLQEDRGAYDRALALLDEVVERQPDHLLARLRRAALRAHFGPEAEVFAEHRQIADAAVGTPFEAVARLELARRHLTRGQAPEALALYQALEPEHPWLACVLASEVGVATAMTGDGMAAIAHFERALSLTTPAAMQTLQETSKQLLGETYWAFWSTVDNVPVRQAQNHAWLAGLRAASGDLATARTHLRQAVACLDEEEVGAARSVLRRELVNRMEEMFPDLAAEPEIQALKAQLEQG